MQTGVEKGEVGDEMDITMDNLRQEIHITKKNKG
jgi:hypothetical protein